MNSEMRLCLAIFFAIGFSTATATYCTCTTEYAPLCGVDGKTYSNACWLGCAGVVAACSGECPCNSCICPQIYDPVCATDGVRYGNPCEAECQGVGVQCKGECPCKGCEGCSINYTPVCSQNSVTYGNKCLAECAGQKVACEGECPCVKPHTASSIPTQQWGGGPVCGVNCCTYANEQAAQQAHMPVVCRGSCSCSYGCPCCVDSSRSDTCWGRDVCSCVGGELPLV